MKDNARRGCCRCGRPTPPGTDPSAICPACGATSAQPATGPGSGPRATLPFGDTLPTPAAGGSPPGSRRLGHAGGSLGPYQVLGALGQGAFGDVYRAQDPRTQRDVAIKVLVRATARARERFQREVEATRRLRHPGIVTLLDSDLESEPAYMVMELVEGASFTLWCESEPPVELRERVRVVQEVARAVQAAHEAGILHRDLKPENVLVDDAGRARVVDFGLARFHGSRSSLTRVGEVLGTPAYMAPEQVGAHDGKVDARTDVYALGATLYHALTGEPPFDGSSPVEVFMALLGRQPEPPSASSPEVPPALDAICLRCLAKEPDQRYGSAGEVAEELGRWLGGEPPQRAGVPLPARLASWLRRYRLPLLTGVLGLAVGGAATAGVALYVNVSPAAPPHVGALPSPQPLATRLPSAGEVVLADPGPQHPRSQEPIRELESPLPREAAQGGGEPDAAGHGEDGGVLSDRRPPRLADATLDEQGDVAADGELQPIESLPDPTSVEPRLRTPRAPPPLPQAPPPLPQAPPPTHGPPQTQSPNNGPGPLPFVALLAGLLGAVYGQARRRRQLQALAERAAQVWQGLESTDT